MTVYDMDEYEVLLKCGNCGDTAWEFILDAVVPNKINAIRCYDCGITYTSEEFDLQLGDMEEEEEK